MDSKDLLEKIESANRQYYDDGQSDISDDEYDALVEYAKSLGLHVPSTLTPPPASGPWSLARHCTHMPGISACARNMEEWVELYAQSGWDYGHLSIKYDGLSVELQYNDDGFLAGAVLRGDGWIGENVLNNVVNVDGVPARVDSGAMAVYGELVISWNNLKLVNELISSEGRSPYKSPRNAVAMARRKGSRQLCRYMAFRPFRAYGPKFGRGMPEDMETLRQLGFNPVDVTRRVNAMDAWVALMRVYSSRDRYQYQMDGVVFISDLGEPAKLKFPPESAVTKVTRIVEQCGNTGVIAPVVEFEPVKLVGAEITRASGHNAVLMGERLDGVGPGAEVMVSRRGDVIPHVESVLVKSEDPWVPSEECPSCGSAVVQDGSIRKCSSDATGCPATSVGLVVKFTKELGIDGFGPGVVSALMNSGLVRYPADLYLADPENMADCVQPGGGAIGKAVAARLHSAMWSRQTMGWGELLGAIGIPGCAKSVMQDIAIRFPDPESLKSATVVDISSVYGIGPKRAVSVRAYLDEKWDSVVQPLLDIVNLRRSGGPLDGIAVCITLALKSCSRPQMEAAIRSAGGVVKNSVSKKVDLLVCNDPDAGTKKILTANRYGIPIISEQELLDRIGSSKFREPEIQPGDEF